MVWCWMLNKFKPRRKGCRNGDIGIFVIKRLTCWPSKNSDLHNQRWTQTQIRDWTLKKWPDFAPISFHRQQVGIPPVDVSIGTTHQKWWCRLKSGVGLVIDCNYILEHSVHHYHNLLQEMYITHILIVTDSIGSVHSHQNHLSDTPWCRFCRFNHHHDCCFKCH